MKLLFISHIHPPAVDGGSKIIWRLRDYFQKNGHQTISLGTNLYSTDDFIKINPPATKSCRRNVSLLPIYRLHRRLPKPIFKLIPLIKFLVSCIKFHPDFIVVGPLPTSIIFYAKLITLFTKSKLIVIPCFHENDPEFTSPLLIKVLRSANLVCTLTNHEKNILTKTYHLRSDNCFTLGAGVDKSFLAKTILKPKKQNILFLGNFAAHKQTELLINSFAQISPRYPKLTLTLAGQKTLYYPQILKVFDKLPADIKQKVTLFPKRYGPRALKRYLGRCSFLVLPSIHESFGLVFIESLARGRPIIGADIPTVSELIHQTKGGLTFKSQSAKSLAMTISKLLDSPNLVHKLGVNGYQSVKNYYTWDKIGGKLCQKIGC